MNKKTVFVIVALTLIALGFALIPNGSSQVEDVRVLSYSWYMDPYGGQYLIMVGEAQNIGSNVIDNVTMAGTFYAPDGTEFMYNYARGFVFQILPQQKTPFYIMFTPSNIMSGTSWTPQDITNYTVTVVLATPTQSRQYQGLEVTAHSASTDENGYYYVTGTVKNTGSQPTNRTWVVATFYNSTGGVVAVGYSESESGVYLKPDSISPGGTAPFTIYPLDASAVSSSIASYSLTIQTELTAHSETPTPTPSASPSASQTPTPSGSTSPTPSTPPNGTGIPDIYIYTAVVLVIVAIAIAAAALLLRKRTGKSAATSQQKE